MRDIYQNNKIFIHKLLLLLVIGLLVIVAVFLMSYIAPFVAGYIISLVLSPLVGLLHRKWSIPRGLTAAVLILTLLAAIGLVGGLLIGRIMTEIGAFINDFGFYLESAQILLENFLYSIGGNFQLDFDLLSAQVLTLATGLLQGAMDGGGFFTAIPYAVLRILLTIISAFFFIKDKEVIKDFLVSLFPKRLVTRAKIVREGVLRALVGYAKGQLIVMAYVSTISVLGLAIIGSPYALFIGLGIGVFDLIPVFGAGGILIPWAALSALNGNMAFAVGLLVVYGIIFLARQILEPKVVGKQIGIHPLILLMSVYVGITTMGPVGILAGPLITLTIKTIMEAEWAKPGILK